MRLSDYFAARAADRPEALAYIDSGAHITFAEANAFIDAAAHVLRAMPELSQSKTPHLAIYSPNDYRVPLLQAAANRADFVFVGIHTRNSVAVNAEVLRFFDARVIVFHSQYEAAISELRSLLPEVEAYICIDGESELGPSLASLIEPYAGTPFQTSYVNMGQMAFMAPTGGTTGPSKGVMHSHLGLETLVHCVRFGFDFNESSRYLAVAPLTHAGGALSLGCSAIGGCSVIMREFDAGEVLKVIESDRITHMFIPPTVLYALLAHPDIEERDLTSMRCLITGAAPTAPEKFKEAVRRFGPVIYEGYGQSEAGVGVIVKKPSDYLLVDGRLDDAAIRAAGRPNIVARVEIFDELGQACAIGQPGEIAIQSSLAMIGYYKNPDATREITRGSWRLTGDIGVRDQEGFITIVDRKKDMIITGGFNVFPAQIESVIGSHASVLDCAVVGVPDEKWGEAVTAVVQLRPGHSVEAAELIECCKMELGSVYAPKTIEFWEDLPRSSVGKVLRREVRDKFWRSQERLI